VFGRLATALGLATYEVVTTSSDDYESESDDYESDDNDYESGYSDDDNYGNNGDEETGIVGPSASEAEAMKELSSALGKCV
jgi:hypothetical protein